MIAFEDIVLEVHMMMLASLRPTRSHNSLISLRILAFPAETMEILKQNIKKYKKTIKNYKNTRKSIKSIK